MFLRQSLQKSLITLEQVARFVVRHFLKDWLEGHEYLPKYSVMTYINQALFF